MTDSIFEQMADFHDHYNVREVVEKMDSKTLLKFLDFRMAMMQEEIYEMTEAMDNGDPDAIVDAIIDLIVFAAGTLDLYSIDGDQAWDEVMRANMNKEVGVKEGRENPYGLPDLIKPEGWEPPSHEDNLGKLRDLFDV